MAKQWHRLCLICFCRVSSRLNLLKTDKQVPTRNNETHETNED